MPNCSVRLNTAICLDESIVSLANAQHAHELGACRIINIKLGRVGGYSEAKEIQAFAQAHGMPVWCGGMLEAGIGRAHNIALSTLLRLHAAGRCLCFERYWEEDIIEPPVTVSRAGTITAPTGHGIGFEVNEDFVDALTVRRETFGLVKRSVPGTWSSEWISSRLTVSQPRLLSALLCVLLPAVAAAEETRLLRRPTVSRDLVVFAYASDLWAVGRTGGQARRLTATPFVETDPRLSPDGSQIAFTATVGGNTDVYVMPASGANRCG